MDFYFVAIDHLGEKVTGTLASDSQAQAQKELLGRYSAVLEVRQNEQIRQPTKPFQARTDSVAIFFRRFATLLGAGVAIEKAFDFLVDSEPDPGLRLATEHFASLVTSGSRMSQAMKSPLLRDIFDPVTVEMIALAEQTGSLHKALGRVAEVKERQRALTRSLVAALTYPCALAIAIFGLGLIFVFVLGPGDESLFSTAGATLPWPTRVVQSLSTLLRDPAAVLFLAMNLVVAPLLFRHYLRTNARFRLRFHEFLVSLPVVGNTLRKIECARILLVMSEGLKSGVPLATVLKMACDACTNDYIRLDLGRSVKAFLDGQEFAEAMSQTTVFPPMVLSMMEVGLESGKLDVILARASASFDDDVQIALAQLSRLAEPLLLMVAGLLSAFLAVATLLPFMGLLQNL